MATQNNSIAAPSRRGLIAALALAPVAIVGPAAAKPAPSVAKAATSAEWRRRVATYRTSDQAYSAFCRDRFDPASAAWRAREDTRKAELQSKIDAVPHYETTSKYETMENGWRAMSTANDVHVSMAKTFVRKSLVTPADDFGICCIELDAALQRREAAIEALRKAAPAEVFSPDLVSECDRREELTHASFAAVRDFQASSLADLIAKIELLQHEAHEIDHAELLASLHRISAGGRA